MWSLALAIGACALASPVVAQDLFQKETKFLAPPGGTMQTVNANESGLTAHVSVASANTWYKTITPDGLNLCLDAPGGTAYNGNMLWLWDCNGLDGQIWVFDANHQIRFGADEHFCIDAGDMTNGVQLMLWECNDMPQQSWAWDGDAKKIVIKDTATCLDLWDQDDGTPGWTGQKLHVWECNGLANQEWDLLDSPDPTGGGPAPAPADVYKTITPDGLNLCLDAPGGTAYNGNMLWLWDCNGLDGQIWVFDANNQIRFGADEHFCIDAGDMTNGVQLMLWECNDMPQQSWAWDGDAKKIFIKDTATCLDLWDQDDGTPGWTGQKLHVWECNGLSNQQWNLRDSANPSGPTPGPPPPGPTPDYFDSCSDPSGGQWPSFSDESSLQSDSQWSAYFKLVYGEIPSFGYPICLSGFRVLHIDALQSAGISLNKVSSPQMGDYYEEREFDLTAGAAVYAGRIYHGFCSGQCFGSNQWVEGLHCGTSLELNSAWYYFGTGSGVWIYSGSTKAYPNRHEFQLDMGFPSSCGQDFECGGELFHTAKSQHGYDTIQLTNEATIPHGIRVQDPMFISTMGVGSYTCGASQTLWKAGWAAQNDCNCDQSRHCQNCQGFASPGCVQTMLAV